MIQYFFLYFNLWYDLLFKVLSGVKKSIIMFFKIVNQLSINLDIIEN